MVYRISLPTKSIKVPRYFMPKSNEVILWFDGEKLHVYGSRDDFEEEAKNHIGNRWQRRGFFPRCFYAPFRMEKLMFQTILMTLLECFMEILKLKLSITNNLSQRVK